MSSSPFVATTTPNIDRANRLMALRQHPGFADLIRLSQDMVQSAVDNCSNYPGWDPQQIVVLKVRQQTATEYHSLLLARISEVIQSGVEEMRAQIAAGSAPEKSVSDIVDQGDRVRQAVLTKFEEMDKQPPNMDAESPMPTGYVRDGI